MEQQVVKVDRVRREQRLLVGGIDLGNDAVLIAAAAFFNGGSHQLGGFEAVLGGADPLAQFGGRVVGGIEIEIGQDLLDERPLVGRVENGEVGLQADPGSVLPENLRTEPVERADPDARAGQQRLDPLGHFLGGLVGERDRENLPGGDAALDEAGDATGDDAGFARARTRDAEQGAFKMVDGGPLRFG